jgi:hypothetical protein
VYRALDRYFAKNNIPENIYNRVANIVFKRINTQGVAEGDMYGDEEVSWEKGGRRAPTGAFRNPAANNVVFLGTGDNGSKYEIIQSGDDFMIHANGKHIDSYSSLQRAMSVLKNEVPGLQQGVAEGKKCNHTMEGTKCPVHGLAECPMQENKKLKETSAGSVAGVNNPPGKNSGKKKSQIGSLFGGTYKQPVHETDFAGEKTTPPQKPGDQVRGTEKAVKKGKQQPFYHRLVGNE